MYKTDINKTGSSTSLTIKRVYQTSSDHKPLLSEERDVALWYTVRSWCDESSDRSLMVDPLSYF